MHAKKKIRLHAVSLFPVYRHGLAAGLGHDERIEMVGCSASPEGLTSDHGFDVLLTDLSSAITMELTLIAACAQTGKRTVILGSPEQAQEMYEAMVAGASAFISKTLPVSEIAAVIVDVYAGRQPLAYPEFDERVWGRWDTDTAALTVPGETAVRTLVDGLTRTEDDILMMMSQGLTNREIAQKMSVSERTVRRYLTAIFRKIGVKNRIAAIAKILRESG